MDKLAFLDGDSPAESAAVVSEAEPAPIAAEVTDTAPVEATPGQPRGPDGKFLPKSQDEAAPAVEAKPEAAAAPQEPATTPEPEAAKPEEDEVTQLRAQRDALQKALTAERAQRRQASAAYAPDPQTDPEGYEAYHERERALTFEWSFRNLSSVHGQETASKIADWAGEHSQHDPHWYERALSSPDPAGFAYAEFQREQALQMLMDPDFRTKFAAFQTSAVTPNPAPSPVVAPPQSPSPPPRSLAAAPNAGGAKPGAIPVGPGVAFDMNFKE